MRKLPWDRILLLALFAVAMGYMEAVIVVYIRAIGGMIPLPAGQVNYHELLARLPGWVVPIETTREAATILMLATVALAAGRRPAERGCLFLLVFGVWDLTYYAGLKLLLDWPERLTTVDLLFLIPKPWFAPVWVPLLASAGMVVVALGLYPRLRRRER